MGGEGAVAACGEHAYRPARDGASCEHVDRHPDDPDHVHDDEALLDRPLDSGEAEEDPFVTRRVEHHERRRRFGRARVVEGPVDEDHAPREELSTEVVGERAATSDGLPGPVGRRGRGGEGHRALRDAAAPRPGGSASCGLPRSGSAKDHSTTCPTAAAYRSIVDRRTSELPASTLATADWEVPMRAATWVWVSPSEIRRASRSSDSARRRAAISLKPGSTGSWRRSPAGDISSMVSQR